MLGNVYQYCHDHFGSLSLCGERTFSKGHFAALTIAIRAKGYREIALRSLAEWVPWEGDLRTIGEEVGERARGTFDQLAKRSRRGGPS